VALFIQEAAAAAVGAERWHGSRHTWRHRESSLSATGGRG